MFLGLGLTIDGWENKSLEIEALGIYGLLSRLLSIQSIALTLQML